MTEPTTIEPTPSPASNSSQKSYAVVGGGMLGIAAALEISKRGHRVTLFDSSPQLGGLATGWKLGDVTWDRFYHVILLSDSYVRTFLEELGIEDRMEWVQTRTGFYSNSRLYSLSSSLDFALFPVLNPIQKMRLGATIFFGSKIRDWQALEKISVQDWLRRWSGESTFRKIWLPLLKCKLGEAYTRTNAAFIWAYIQRMYSARRSGLKREMFGYMPGGYDHILQRTRDLLVRRGIEIRINTRVARIAQQAESRWQITSAAADKTERNPNQEDTFDRVIVTTPSPNMLEVIPDLPSEVRDKLEQTEYLGVVCTSVLLDRPLGGYYVTNIIDPGIPLTGVIEMGTILPPEKLGGHYLVYLPRYLLANDPGFEETDDVIHERCIATLERMYPEFKRQQVRTIQTARAKYVMAIPTLNYSQQRAPIRSGLTGLYLLNSARIVDGTLNVNEVLRLVHSELPSILDEA